MTGANQAILVKVDSDAGWSASMGSIGRDPIGFLLVKETSNVPVTLRFGGSWSVWLGRTITLLTILLLVLMEGGLQPARGLSPALISATALIPAITAYVILQLQTPSSAVIAEEAYRRLQPPLISPAAIIDGVTFAPPPLARGSVISLFGTNLGSPSDAVRVWVGQRQAEILYRGPNQVNWRLPADAPAVADVSVEVNGCHGNSFSVVTK